MARVASITDFKDLTPAEAAFIAAIRAGEPCILGEDRPDEPSPDRDIRAGLLRTMILGGPPDCETPDAGFDLMGAYVTGVLDLSFTRAKGRTGLFLCRFAEPVNAMQAELQGLNLQGSALPGLNLQGAMVATSVFLRISGTTPFHATGEVRLSGAIIGGQLACSGARFDNAGDVALIAENLKVTGNVFLCAEGDAPFHATGEVRLPGSSIGGQLDCNGARFENPKGYALMAENMVVDAGFAWRGINPAHLIGQFSLAQAHVGVLTDEAASWPSAPGQLILDGFTYDRIAASFTDAKRRIAWLEKGTVINGTFYPQPYTHLAKVLRAMGYDRDARAVMHAQARILTREARKQMREKPDGPPYLTLESPWVEAKVRAHQAFYGLVNLTVGYGYRPFYALWSLLALWLIATLLAHMTWTEGAFAPNSDVVLVSDQWNALVEIDCVPKPIANCIENPASVWSSFGKQGLDWDSFNAAGYAADLVIPILDLGQTDAWAPSKDRGPWGWGLWWGRWVLAACGWIVSGFGVAAVTGIMQRSAPKE